MKVPYDVIFIGGAPGAGKSSVAQLLQKQLNSPCFEFGWIPEFRNKGVESITYKEEEGIAFENLVLVAHNYVKHGYKNIIITDLEDKRIKNIDISFGSVNYILFTLVVDDNNVLKSRVLNETRSSAYRDYEQAIAINQDIANRSLSTREKRIDSTEQSVADTAQQIIEVLNGVS